MACSVCGGSHTTTATPAATTTAMTKPSTKSTCEVGPCCPNPFVPSCETQNALAQCVKTAFCDVLRCLADLLKADLTPPAGTKANPIDCLKTAIVSFAECVPDALCGPKATPPPIDDALPCDFAVEEQRSLKAVPLLIATPSAQTARSVANVSHR